MYEKWIEDFVNDNIRYMTEGQVSHFTECAIRLNGTDNLVEAFDKYSYDDFKQLGVLDYEEIQILDTITDEIVYMKGDENYEDNDISTEYKELQQSLSNRGISLVDYKLHGDTGMPIVSLFFYNSINKWIWQEPIERCNRVRQKEFNSFNEAREFVDRYN